MPESQQPMEGVKIVYDKIMEDININVLDIGAGEGKWGKFLKGKVNLIHGVEVWSPYIYKYGLRNLYDKLFNMNMKDFPFGKQKYDVMILGDVLEHLEFNEAVKFINDAKQFIDRIYLIIPTSLCVQDGAYWGNPYESHLYQWTDQELKDLFQFELLHEGYNPNGLVKIGTYVWKK